MAQPITLTEDEADDLVYFARAGDAEELAATLTAAMDAHGASAVDVLVAGVDGGKNTALHMAAGNGHEDVVRLLLDRVAAAPQAARLRLLDAANAYENTALHWAALNGHLGVVRLLVEQGGASPALANDKNYVPLDLAGLHDKTAVVDYFLAAARKDEAAAEAEAAAGGDGDGDGLSQAAAGLDLNADKPGDDDDDEEVVLRAGTTS